MNLKEAFRYQSFLEKLMMSVQLSLAEKDHAMKTTEIHHCSLSNPEAHDRTEQVDKGEFFLNDDVIRLGVKLIEEKSKLCNAITAAKAASGANIDAEIETNKFRQKLTNSITQMLKMKPGKKKTQARGYKFDVNQTQVSYIYDMEVVDEDNFDREQAKKIARHLAEESDLVSTSVEMALVNTQVNYDPPFNVNSNFEDVMQEFLSE